MKTNKNEIVKIVKFGLTGIMNTIVDWAVSSICFVLIKLSEVLSNGIGYAAGLIFSYTVNRRWTFKTKEKFFSAEMLKFFANGVIMLLINMGLTKLFVDVIFANSALSDTLVYYISKAIITAIVMVLNYLSSRFLIFRNTQKQGPDDITEK